MERFIVTTTTWDELDSMGYPSVTDYCRALVKDKKTPLPDRIEVYRGDMLCFTVNDVSAMAGLQPTGTGFKIYDKRREKGGVEPRTAI